jgi:katanin p60 ATPase-containing subunit A1
MSLLAEIKVNSKAKEQEQKILQERKRGLIALIIRYLIDQGFLESAERLQTESGFSLKKFDVADNIDLFNILVEYEDFYYLKFGRKPKFIKKIAGLEEESGGYKTNIKSYVNKTCIIDVNH